MDTQRPEPTKPASPDERPLERWTSPPILFLVAATGMLTGALIIVGGYSFISASSVATIAQLVAAAATSIMLLVVLWKVRKWFFSLLRNPSADAKAGQAPKTSLLTDLTNSWFEWRSGKPLSETPLVLRADIGPLVRNSVRYAFIAIASMSLLGMVGLLVTLAQLFLTQVQTRRLEAQNRLLVAQNNITAEHQRFEQATARADAEYTAAEKVLLDVTSPLALQEQKLYLLPEIAAIQVPVITVREDRADGDNPSDQCVEVQVTFPNAPRVRSLLLNYMKMDRVGQQLRAPLLARSSLAGSADNPPLESERDLMLDLESELKPLSEVSTALFCALHRLGPVTLKGAKTDAEIAALPSLWKLGESFSTLDRVKVSNNRDLASSVHSQEDSNLNAYALRSGSYPWDFRHLNPSVFREIQAPGAEISGTRGREAIFPADAQFISAQVQFAQFIHAQIHGASFNLAQAQGANFSGADLHGAWFLKGQLQGTSFHSARLQGSRFYEAQLQGVQFNEIEAQDAHFTDAQVQGGNFTKAHLQGASFFASQLQGSVFEHAKLQGATFREADLCSAHAFLDFRPGVWSLSVKTDGNLILASANVESARVGNWDVIRFRRQFAGRQLHDLWLKALSLPNLDKEFGTYVRSVLVYAPELPIPAKHENALKMLVTPEVYAKDWERISQPTSLIGARFADEKGGGAIYIDAKTKIEWQEALKTEIAEVTLRRDKTAPPPEEAKETNELLQAAPQTLLQLEYAVTDPAAMEQRKNWFLYREVQKLREDHKASRSSHPASTDPRANPTAPK